MKQKLILLSFVISFANMYGKTLDLGSTEIYSETGYATNLRNATSSPFIITAKEIEEKKFTSVSEILSSISAVTIREGNEPEIDIRGQGYSKARATVQVMVDGIPFNMLDSSHRKVPLNTINPTQIERIEVIPGGGSVLYGNGTAGGVINIITKKLKGNYANIGYQYGSFDSQKYNFSAGTRINNFDFAVDYSKNKKDGYRRNVSSDSDYFSARVVYNFNKTDNIALKYRGYRSDYDQYNMLTKAQIDKDRRQNGIAPNTKAYAEQKIDEFSLNINKKLGMNNTVTFNSYHIKTDTDSFTENTMLHTKSIRESEDKRFGFKLKDQFHYGKGSTLVFGGGYTQHSMFLNGIEIKKKTLETFALNTYKLNQFHFSQGLRFEQAKYEGNSNKKLNNVAGNLALNYLYSDTGNVYLKYERAFNTPAPLQTIKNVNWKTTTNDAKAETSNTYEIGVKDYIDVLHSTISASVYYSQTNDELKTVWYKGFHNLSDFSTINYGKTKRYGFDLHAEQKFENLRLSESYSFIQAKLVKLGETPREKAAEGSYIPDVPRHKLVLSADYDLNEHISLGASYQYQAATYLDTANKLGKDGKKSFFNIRANYKFNDNLNIYVGIKNLFNNKYYESVGISRGHVPYKTYNPAETRNYYLGFNYTF